VLYETPVIAQEKYWSL